MAYLAGFGAIWNLVCYLVGRKYPLPFFFFFFYQLEMQQPLFLMNDVSN